MATLTYGDHQLDLSALPETSLLALAQEGFTHYMGNRVASRVHGHATKEAGADATKEAIAAWKSANAEAISELSAKFRADTVRAIREGTLGVHAPRGPSASADPLMAEMRKIAKQEITDILAAGGMKFPGKKDGKELTVTLKGREFTGEQLISNRLDPEYTADGRVAPGTYRKAIEVAAKRNLDARAKAASKNAEAGVDSLV